MTYLTVVVPKLARGAYIPYIAYMAGIGCIVHRACLAEQKSMAIKD